MTPHTALVDYLAAARAAYDDQGLVGSPTLEVPFDRLVVTGSGEAPVISVNIRLDDLAWLLLDQFEL